MMRFASCRPCGSVVLVEPLPEETSIILPDGYIDTTFRVGRVRAQGGGTIDGGRRVPPEVAFGDMVIFAGVGVTIEIGGVDVREIEEGLLEGPAGTGKTRAIAEYLKIRKCELIPAERILAVVEPAEQPAL